MLWHYPLGSLGNVLQAPVLGCFNSQTQLHTVAQIPALLNQRQVTPHKRKVIVHYLSNCTALCWWRRWCVCVCVCVCMCVRDFALQHSHVRGRLLSHLHRDCVSTARRLQWLEAMAGAQAQRSSCILPVCGPISSIYSLCGEACRLKEWRALRRCRVMTCSHALTVASTLHGERVHCSEQALYNTTFDEYCQTGPNCVCRRAIDRSSCTSVRVHSRFQVFLLVQRRLDRTFPNSDRLCDTVSKFTALRAITVSVPA